MKKSSNHQAKFSTVDAAQTQSKENVLNLSPEYQIKATFVSKSHSKFRVFLFFLIFFFLGRGASLCGLQLVRRHLPLGQLMGSEIVLWLCAQRVTEQLL